MKRVHYSFADCLPYSLTVHWIVICFILVSLICEGQSISNVLNRYVEDVKSSSSNSVPSALLATKEANSVIQTSFFHYKDSSAAVRSRMYSLTGKVGLTSSETDIRRLAVDQLVRAHWDSENSNLGILWNILSQFRSTDFSNSARDTLRLAFNRKPAHQDHLMKLLGYLQMIELKEEIRQFTLPPTPKKDRWAALLSLARMGDKESNQLVLNKIKNLKINDEVIYNVFPDLVYTRQPVLIDYVVSVLNDTEKKCLSEDEIPVMCGYRIMEQLAPIIEGYPVQVDASGDIRTNDYVKALNDVRNWFHQKGSDYRIINNRF